MSGLGLQRPTGNFQVSAIKGRCEPLVTGRLEHDPEKRLLRVLPVTLGEESYQLGWILSSTTDAEVEYD